MTPHDRLRISIATARYLDALERDDDATLTALWEAAANDPEMLTAFHDINAGLFEEEVARDQEAFDSVVATAVEKHLPSAEIVKPASGPVTVGDAANELFRHTPDRLPAVAHALNDRLRTVTDPLPADLGLPSLVAWAEGRYGIAPPEYWEAFRRAAIKVRMRHTADTEFRMAARRTPPKPEDSR